MIDIIHLSAYIYKTYEIINCGTPCGVYYEYNHNIQIWELTQQQMNNMLNDKYLQTNFLVSRQFTLNGLWATYAEDTTDNYLGGSKLIRNQTKMWQKLHAKCDHFMPHFF